MFSAPPFAASRPPAPPWQRQRAFSIAEVMMATFVLAFGITSSIVAIQMGFRNIDLARGTTIAAQIIQSEMERLRMMSFTTISALPATQTFDGATYFSTVSQIANRYTITREVTDDATYGSDVKNITVRVAWNTFDGRPHERSFTALYARNGLYDYYYTIAHP